MHLLHAAINAKSDYFTKRLTLTPAITENQNNMASSRLISDRLLVRHQPWPNAEPRNQIDNVLQARRHQITPYYNPLVRVADSMTWEGIVEQVVDPSPPASEGMGPASLLVRMMGTGACSWSTPTTFPVTRCWRAGWGHHTCCTPSMRWLMVLWRWTLCGVDSVLRLLDQSGPDVGSKRKPPAAQRGVQCRCNTLNNELQRHAGTAVNDSHHHSRHPR